MANINDFIIQLEAVIDQSSLDREQKKLLKKSLKVNVEVDKDKTTWQYKRNLPWDADWTP